MTSKSHDDVVAACITRVVTTHLRSRAGGPGPQRGGCLSVPKFCGTARLIDESLKRSITIAEIADACGFANQEHLTRLFKRLIGFPPGAYRRRLHASRPTT